MAFWGFYSVCVRLNIYIYIFGCFCHSDDVNNVIN